jgi:plastocyanin
MLVSDGRRTRLLAPWILLLLLVFVTAGPASATSATVVQRNYSFSPSTVTVSQGGTVAVQNATASTQHTFTVSGEGIDVVTNGGQTSSVTINLPPGTYPFICRFHVGLGMKGTLVVQGASGGSVAPVGGPQTGAGGTAGRPFPALPVGIGAVMFLVGGAAIFRNRRSYGAR